MMKRSVPLLLLICWLPPARAGYADGLISAGEYEWQVDWYSGTLVVDGGGASVVEAWNSSRVEVWSTTPFLPFPHQSGITDLCLGFYSLLDYYGGETEELTLQEDATAYLHGGRIDGITSYQYGTTERIFIYAQEGWSWTYDNAEIRGITGLWWDSMPFNIRFTSNPWQGEYGPAWTRVKVITPEPATLLLMAVGGLLLRRRR